MSYKILWYSMPALHDNSNGAAMHNKILLEALAARGIQVKVLNALVADDPRGLEVFQRIGLQINHDPNSPYLQFTDAGVEYVVAKTHGNTCPTITGADQSRIFDLFVQFLEIYQPDVVMGYSGDVFSAYLRHEARVRGIPVVYALCNGLHRSFGFADCDLVFTPSKATAQLYKESDNIDVKAVGQFIYKERVIAPDRSQAKYVTLVNPTPEKGLAITVKLANIFAKKHPEVRFLVVKSVGDYTKILRGLHYADGSPFIVENQPSPIANIDVAEHTDDIRLVYQLTKVLLTPSVWHEAWGCVATEAVFNGIPVLSSKSGGLPEAVGEGGILLDAPASTQRDFYCVPSDEEIAPWVEALERLLAEDWTEQCAKAAAANDLDVSVNNLLKYLEPLMAQGQKEKKPLDKSYFFSQKTMENRRQAYDLRLAQAQELAKQQAKAHEAQVAAMSSEQAKQEAAASQAVAQAEQEVKEALASETPADGAKKPLSLRKDSEGKRTAAAKPKAPAKKAPAKKPAAKTTAKKAPAKKPAAAKK